MTTKSKLNMLKNMDINEISLVVAGMNPGADVIMTKGRPADWRAAITGDIEVGKAFNAKEARDKAGKWTSAAIGAIGGKQGSYRRQVAQAFSNKARAIAHATVGHTISAVKSTRPSGANPVEGGGVQFSFEHKLADGRDIAGNTTPGVRVTSSVQVRPEHLGDVGEGKTPNKAQRALYTLHRSIKTLNRPVVPAFGGSKKFSFMRAHVHGSDLARAATNMFSPGAQQPAPTSTSTEAPSSGIGWKPPSIPATWVRDTQNLHPVGRGRRTDPSDPEAPAIPLQGPHTARTAGGWAYHTKEGHFIPAGRPDVQEHMEKVHQEMDRMPPNERAAFIRNRAGGAYVNVAEDKGYFTHGGHYIPPVGDQNNRTQLRLRYEEKYKREDERKSTVDALHGREGGPAMKLFGPQSPGGGREEYDTGTSEQRHAALHAAREDMTRKSLFPMTYPESLVKRLPPGPYYPSLFWHLGNGTPGFASRDAGEPVIKRKKLFDA
jgi:hypothetical protein